MCLSIFLAVIAGDLLVFISNLGHYLVKSVGADCFNAFRFVDLIDRNALVLQSEEEKHHLVDLLGVPLFFLLLFLKFKPKFLFLY